MKPYQSQNIKSRDEIIEELYRRAAVYVPEWRIPDHGHDVGSVLSYLYADTLYQLGKQGEQLPEKNKIEFFRSLDASVRPAVPARGYVVFEVEQDLDEGVPLPTATGLTTTAAYPDETPVAAETEGDMELTPSKLMGIYESCRQNDYMGCLYERNPDAPEEIHDISFFTYEEENIQSHRLYLNHPYALSAGNSCQIELEIVPAGKTVPEDILARLQVSYWTKEGWIPFEEQTVSGRSILLRRGKGQPEPGMEDYPEFLDGEASVWICFTADMKNLRQVEASEILIGGGGQHLRPNAMISDGIDGVNVVTAPFGEHFQIYDEWYVACDAACSQKGAVVRLHFTRSFLKTEINQTEEMPIEWKLVMKKGAIRVEKEFDITIAEVVWEYFNGFGWTRLCDDKSYNSLFGTEGGTQDADFTMVFTCPDDMSKIHVGGSEACYIRARVLKVANAFKTAGFYITPVIKNLSFDYEYGGNRKNPDRMILENNRSQNSLTYRSWKQGRDRKIFWGTEDEQPAVYLLFDRRMTGGPFSLLFDVYKRQLEQNLELQLEYHALGGWKELNPVDESCNLGKTGLVTYYGKMNMQRETLFGREGYWFRIRDIHNISDRLTGGRKLKIRGIYQNAVRAVAIESKKEQYFMLNQYREHAVFQLLDQNIYSLNLWVKERGAGSAGQDAWIPWEEADDFHSADAEARIYVLDRSAGTITFGDGRHGKIPPVALEDTIHAIYSVGGGRATNIPAGGVNGLSESMGQVSSVSNPLPFFGGYDQENVPEAIERVSHELKHRDRAVTASDYEDLAFEISRNVKKAACFSGYNEEGEVQSGCMTLALLLGDVNNSGAFATVQSQIYREFEKRIPITVQMGRNFFIVSPVFIRFHIKAELFIADGVSTFTVRSELLKKLGEFFDPDFSGYDQNGWQIGRIPRREEIQTILTGSQNVRHVKNLIITCEKVKGKQGEEMTLEQASQCMYTLPINGEHELIFHSQKS